MAAATIVPAASSIALQPVVSAVDPGEMARKRRREIVGGSVENDALAATAPKMARAELEPAPVLSAPLVLVATQPIVTVRKSASAKRPQMKYDPSIPMTKEETSAWRREQRRKRNRESAAACRRRQRDRISELEDELSGWKARFDDALTKLRGLDEEGAEGLESELENMFPSALAFVEGQPKIAERCGTPPNIPQVTTSLMLAMPPQAHVISPSQRSPKFIPPVVTSATPNEEFHFLPLLDAAELKANDISGTIATSDSHVSRVEDREHLKEIIFRPAVKITGAQPDPPLDTIESVCDDLLRVVPDSILSLTEKKTMPFPETCPSLVHVATNGAVLGPASIAANAATPSVTTDEGDEDSDLGEFLLDAVQWL